MGLVLLASPAFWGFIMVQDYLLADSRLSAKDRSFAILSSLLLIMVVLWVFHRDNRPAKVRPVAQRAANLQKSITIDYPHDFILSGKRQKSIAMVNLDMPWRTNHLSTTPQTQVIMARSRKSGQLSLRTATQIPAVSIAPSAHFNIRGRYQPISGTASALAGAGSSQWSPYTRVADEYSSFSVDALTGDVPQRR